MNPELQQYILQYCRSYFTQEEKQALTRSGVPDITTEYYKKAALTNDHFREIFGFHNEATNRLVELGKEKLDALIAERIFTTYKDEIVEELIAERIYTTFNDEIIIKNVCPKCGKMKRTPKAKQCRYCYFDWHKKL